MSTEGATGELALQSQQQRFLRPAVALWGFVRRKPLGAAGLAILVFATVIAFTGSIIAPYDPFETRLDIACRAQPLSIGMVWITWDGTYSAAPLLAQKCPST